MDAAFLPVQPGDTVILDTDIGSDCDDAGAVAVVLLGCRRVGACPVLINDTSNDYGSGALDALAAYYGYADAPVGQWEQPGFFGAEDDGNNRYNLPLTQRFSPRYQAGKPLSRPASEVYRETLESAADGSVVIVTVGFLNAVGAALRADPALFAAKVRSLVVMGGNFATPAQAEWNLLHDVPASRLIIEHAPCPVYFSGFEVGVDLITGYTQRQEDHPVCEAYYLHSGGSRYSWDPCTADFAFEGEGDWHLSEPLSVTVADDGSLTLTPDPTGTRRYLRFADDAAKLRIATRINAHLTAIPTEKE